MHAFTVEAAVSLDIPDRGWVLQFLCDRNFLKSAHHDTVEKHPQASLCACKDRIVGLRDVRNACCSLSPLCVLTAYSYLVNGLTLNTRCLTVVIYARQNVLQVNEKCLKFAAIVIAYARQQIPCLEEKCF